MSASRLQDLRAPARSSPAIASLTAFEGRAAGAEQRQVAAPRSTSHPAVASPRPPSPRPVIASPVRGHRQPSAVAVGPHRHVPNAPRAAGRRGKRPDPSSPSDRSSASSAEQRELPPSRRPSGGRSICRAARFRSSSKPPPGPRPRGRRGPRGRPLLPHRLSPRATRRGVAASPAPAARASTGRRRPGSPAPRRSSGGRPTRPPPRGGASRRRRSTTPSTAAEPLARSASPAGVTLGDRRPPGPRRRGDYSTGLAQTLKAVAKASPRPAPSRKRSSRARSRPSTTAPPQRARMPFPGGGAIPPTAVVARDRRPPEPPGLQAFAVQHRFAVLAQQRDVARESPLPSIRPDDRVAPPPSPGRPLDAQALDGDRPEGRLRASRLPGVPSGMPRISLKNALPRGPDTPLRLETLGAG